MVKHISPSALKGWATRHIWQGIGFKIGLGPAIGVGMLLVLLGLTLSAVQAGLGSVTVQDQAIEATTRGQEASSTMLSLQSDLFKLSTWLFMQGNPDDANRIKADISAELDSLKALSIRDRTLISAQQIEFIQSKTAGALLLLERNASLGFQNTSHLAKEIANIRNGILDQLKQRLARAQDAHDTLVNGFGTARWALLIAGAVQIVVLVVAAVVVGRSLTTGIRRLTSTMTCLAKGPDADLRQPVPGVNRVDELGEMAKAVLVFKDAAVENARLQEEAARHRASTEEARVRNEQAQREAIEQERVIVVKSIGAALSKLAAKDLTYRMPADIPAAYRELHGDFNAAIAQLEEVMRSVTGSTNAIHSGTQEISTASDDLSRRTEQQAASLEETAAALDEITSTVKRTAEGARHAREVVSAATAGAEQSGIVVRKAIEAMVDIDKSSKHVSQIIGVIDEIAFQTNLLALNAGVEAARAGDAGRGFAVVASEVRALAQRSAEAAREIKGLIATSAARVDQGVELVEETGKALERIVAQVSEINSVVSAIAASAQEQATGLEQVNTAINQMDQVTQQNAAMVEESTAASHSLSQETTQLSDLIKQFQVGLISTATPSLQHATRSTSDPYSALKNVA